VCVGEGGGKGAGCKNGEFNLAYKGLVQNYVDVDIVVNHHHVHVIFVAIHQDRLQLWFVTRFMQV